MGLGRGAAEPPWGAAGSQRVPEATASTRGGCAGPPYRKRAHLDRLFFPNTLDHLREHPGLTIVRDDIRTFDPSLLDGIEAVCDLAALSNDPAGELDPEQTMAINFRGRARVARLAKAHGVRRYVLASSCSIYGFQDGMLDERSESNPLTVYAHANLAAERASLPLAGEDLAVTVLRQATVYGLSPGYASIWPSTV